MKYLNYVFAIVVFNWLLISAFGFIPWPKNDIQALSEPRVVTQVSTSLSVTPKETTTTTSGLTNDHPNTQPTQAPQPILTATPVPAVPTCVVSIQGKQYDVQRLRSTHSGGDIFVCGSDMTSTFFSMHNQSLLDGAMQQYLIQ